MDKTQSIGVTFRDLTLQADREHEQARQTSNLAKLMGLDFATKHGRFKLGDKLGVIKTVYRQRQYQKHKCTIEVNRRFVTLQNNGTVRITYSGYHGRTSLSAVDIHAIDGTLVEGAELWSA